MDIRWGLEYQKKKTNNMTTKTKSLHFYSRIFDNFDILKGAGILSDERIEEIKKYCAKENFQPTVLQDGRRLDNWRTHMPSGKVFAQTVVDSSSYYWLCDQILMDFLTDQEVEKLNKDADQRYREARNKEQFDKAEKLKEEEWNGPVYCDGLGYNEGYFADLNELYDDIQYDRENDEEFIMPDYVWTCHTFPACHIHFSEMLENACQEVCEDFDIQSLHGLDELKTAIDKFNELNKDNVTWTPNHKKCVILNK